MVIIKVVFGAIAWVLKNVALIVGVVEAILKAVTGLIVATPTKRDDEYVLPKIDAFFSAFKKVMYDLSDAIMGKESKG